MEQETGWAPGPLWKGPTAALDVRRKEKSLRRRLSATDLAYSIIITVSIALSECISLIT
jgi:hypothetical protein